MVAVATTTIGPWTSLNWRLGALSSSRRRLLPGKRLNNLQSQRPRTRLVCSSSADPLGGVNELEEDYYSVLGVEPDATQEEIKRAYYSCMKVCHPDLIGNEDGATNFCMFLNEIYEVLSNPDRRMVYDEINGYALTAVNPFADTRCKKDKVFVDEFSCIGCKNCSNTVSDTFEIEEDYGRARVKSQTGNPELIETAMQTCPVDCIHWVSDRQLALLEDEMRRMERVDVGVMLSGMGSQSADVFAVASSRWEKKQKEAIERAKLRAVRESGMYTAPWWQGMWSVANGGTQDSSERREKASRAAAAARRWREYSRRGVYKRPEQSLPQNKSED